MGSMYVRKEFVTNCPGVIAFMPLLPKGPQEFISYPGLCKCQNNVQNNVYICIHVVLRFRPTKLLHNCWFLNLQNEKKPNTYVQDGIQYQPLFHPHQSSFIGPTGFSLLGRCRKDYSGLVVISCWLLTLTVLWVIICLIRSDFVIIGWFQPLQ